MKSLYQNKLPKVLIVFLLFFLFLCPSRASAEYFLPYPSAMPGSIFYKLNLVKDELLKYWDFGNFGQFLYNLKQSDKYLVEAKTLFEYKQYLLGYQALIKSDKLFSNTLPYLLKAKDEGKDISQNRELLRQASVKHIEVLSKMKSEVPKEFTWTPEKAPPTQLNLESAINNSIEIRKKFL